MNRYIALITIILSIGSVGSRNMATQRTVVIESDVAEMPSLPGYGTICTETYVYGSPEGTQVLYSVSVGDVVQLREQPRFNHRDWVMIKPAQWIPLAAICK